MSTTDSEHELSLEGDDKQRPTIAATPQAETTEKTNDQPETKDLAADLASFGEAPDGGMRAWLVAAGGACITFTCFGFANSFGVFQEYYMTHQLQGDSPDKIAWIGSLGVFLHFAAGAITGPLFDRYGAWVCRLYPYLFSHWEL